MFRPCLQQRTRLHCLVKSHRLSHFRPLPGRSIVGHESYSSNVCCVLYSSSIPAWFRSPLSNIQVQRLVARHSRSLLITVFNTDFFVARQVFYPIQFCIYSDASLSTWFEWLFHDAAYLESVLLGMSAMDDFFRGQPPSRLTYSHLKATITALNGRLSDASLCLADSTIAVVMGLAELAGMLSDETAAKAHISGFQRMVLLRGGLESFAGNTKLQIKIGR